MVLGLFNKCQVMWNNVERVLHSCTESSQQAVDNIWFDRIICTFARRPQQYDYVTL